MYLDETKGSLETTCMQTGIWELADAVNVKDIMVVRHSQKERSLCGHTLHDSDVLV